MKCFQQIKSRLRDDLLDKIELAADGERNSPQAEKPSEMECCNFSVVSVLSCVHFSFDHLRSSIPTKFMFVANCFSSDPPEIACQACTKLVGNIWIGFLYSVQNSLFLSQERDKLVSTGMSTRKFTSDMRFWREKFY